MAIGRQTLRTAIVLTCTAFSLPAFSPSASAQTPPPVENPQAARGASDGQSRDSNEQRQRDRARDQKGDDEERASESSGRRFPGRGRRMREAFAQDAELEQPKVWLGIGLKEVSGDLAAYLGSTKGVLVESVFPDSPAEAAGIKVGDLIIEINGQRVANPPALIEALLKLERSPSQDSGKRDQDDDQKDKGRQRRKEADQKADAEKDDDDEKEKDADRKDADKKDSDKKADKKDADKKDSDKQRDSDKKQSTYPTVHVKLLRQGKEMTVDVTPTERPESLAVAAQQAEQPEQAEQAVGGVSELNRRQLEQLLEEIQRQGGGGRMFRFGLPPAMRQPGAGAAEEQVENVVIVVKDAEGHAAEVRIQRVGDQPPKIMVREDGKTRQLSEEEVEKLPEPVRDAVEQAIKQMDEERASGDGDRGAQGGPRGARERLEAARRFREGLRMGPGGQGILHPEELRELGRYAAELAAAYQHMAEETARRGVEKAQDFATLPDELKQLQSQVQELKRQVEELKKQAKDNQ